MKQTRSTLVGLYGLFFVAFLVFAAVSGGCSKKEEQPCSYLSPIQDPASYYNCMDKYAN